MSELYFEGIAGDIEKYNFLLIEYYAAINSLTNECEWLDVFKRIANYRNLQYGACPSKQNNPHWSIREGSLTVLCQKRQNNDRNTGEKKWPKTLYIYIYIHLGVFILVS